MKQYITIFLTAQLLILTACNNYKYADNAARQEMKSLALSDVSTEGEIGRRIDITINNNLLKINTDEDFIAPFKEKNKSGGYIGIGKLIDASSKFAFYSQDPEVLSVKEHIVNELLDTQEEDGYIGMLEKDSRMIRVWDIHEMGYIIYGLVTDYRLYNNQKSLDAAKKLADYVIMNWNEDIPDNWDNIAFHVAVTGFDRAMLALYDHTKDQKYIDFLTEDFDVPGWDGDIVIGRRKMIEGHIYAYITRTLAQLEFHSIILDDQLLRAADKAVNIMTEGEGVLITGGAGQWECWTNDQDGGHALGETCATAYQMRFYDKLLRMKHDPLFGDLMERTIYNALFAAQSPDGRRIRYYTPIEGDREYFEGDTYCCPNNYRRIIAELPKFIYYNYNDGVAVNLYSQSEAEMDLPDDISLNIRQITDYPNSGQVKIVVNPSKSGRFPVLLRIPSWAKGAKVRLAGSQHKAKPGTFFSIHRRWAANDTITLDLPMEWRFIRGRKRQSGRVALMRGPVVYCLNPQLNQDKGLENMNSYDMGRIIIDPKSVKGPFPYNEVRAGGTKCNIGAWYEGHGMGGEHDMELTLTEFPDPNGKACYFSVRDFNFGDDDELFTKK
jgi:uncharacterized protein